MRLASPAGLQLCLELLSKQWVTLWRVGRKQVMNNRRCGVHWGAGGPGGAEALWAHGLCGRKQGLQGEGPAVRAQPQVAGASAARGPASPRSELQTHRLQSEAGRLQRDCGCGLRFGRAPSEAAVFAVCGRHYLPVAVKCGDSTPRFLPPFIIV